MANPNIVAVTSIYGKTTYLTPSATTSKVLLPNASGSGKVFKINQIVASNSSASAANSTVEVYTSGSASQGSAPSGGTAYPIAYAIAVPGNASLVVVDKTSAIYLEEGTSISVTSGVANNLTFTISYEQISAA
jgi:hypothetical protein